MVIEEGRGGGGATGKSVSSSFLHGHSGRNGRSMSINQV
jgi:hypothetical protein